LKYYALGITPRAVLEHRVQPVLRCRYCSFLPGSVGLFLFGFTGQSLPVTTQDGFEVLFDRTDGLDAERVHQHLEDVR